MTRKARIACQSLLMIAIAAVSGCGLLGGSASTPKPPAERDLSPLGQRLTPFGAEFAGNSEGTIPAWQGGLIAPPSCYRGAGSRYCDPYAGEKPLYTVTAENLANYEKYLSPGQRALFAQFPDSYRMRVFATHRSFANPTEVYAASRINAEHALLDKDRLSKAALGVPFPLPANGAEVITNHRLRYRPAYIERQSMQFAVDSSGDFSQVALHEWRRFAYVQPGFSCDDGNGVLSQLAQLVSAPRALAGTAVLLDDVAQPAKSGRHAWQLSPGDPMMRKVPNLGYDTLGIGTDDLRTNDQLDTFFGPTDHYDFTLRGKQEMLVPANSYALHSDAVPYRELVGKSHLNPDLLRYELRRVWVIEATVRRGLSHVIRSRRLYVDEDGWQIRVVDNDDDSGELWRVQETHSIVAYDRLFELPVAETVYDLREHRYLVQGLNNEAPEVSYPVIDAADFTAGAIARQGRKLLE